MLGMRSGLRPELRLARRLWFANSTCKPDTGPATPLPLVASVARLTGWPHPFVGQLSSIDPAQAKLRGQLGQLTYHGLIAISACKPHTGPATPLPLVASVARLSGWSHPSLG